jgi:hypothetical protein
MSGYRLVHDIGYDLCSHLATEAASNVFLDEPKSLETQHTNELGYKLSAALKINRERAFN